MTIRLLVRLLPALLLVLLGLGRSFDAAPPALAQEKPLDEARSKSLPDQIDAIVKGLRIRGASVGLAVWSVKAGRLVHAIGEREPMLLASNTKILTTAAALCRLGPDFKFRTSIGTIGSEIHVFAGGDPNLSGRFHDDDPVAIFRDWAARLKAAGVTRASGLVLHTGIFDDVHVHPGWQSYDPWSWWAAPFGALSLNDNCVDLKLAPAGDGQPCKVTLAPDTSWVNVVNQTRSSAKAQRPFGFTRPAASNTITLRGDVGGRSLSWVAVHDPTMYFGTVLKETFAAAGIAVGGGIVESAQTLAEADGYRELAATESDLATTLAVCNQSSQNFYAEMIFRTLAWKLKGRGTTPLAIDAVREVLSKEAGIEDFTQSDGSGLTRENRAAAADLVKLLLHLRQHPYGKVFVESLPLNGDRRGTLKNRLLAPDLKGRIRAKTGHIGGVSALSGYVESVGGDTFVFSILANAGEGLKMGLADQMEDKICELLARNRD